MKIDGGCSCGAIKIEGEADPERTQVCHCTDCQTSTGTAFRVSIPVPGNTFKMTGQPAAARPAHPEAADLASLGAAVGHRARRHSEHRDAAGHVAPALRHRE